MRLVYNMENSDFNTYIGVVVCISSVPKCHFRRCKHFISFLKQEATSLNQFAAHKYRKDDHQLQLQYIFLEVSSSKIMQFDSFHYL